MVDIFNETISCKECKMEMKHIIANKNGFELRAIQCPKCRKQIIHPADINGLENFKNLKGKTYNVKLRVVGNSHAISIPKEIVEFMHQQERMMDDMVRLCFEDMHRLSLQFGSENDEDDEDLNQKIDAPPRTKVRGLIGARFLDDRRSDHTLKSVVLGRNDRHNNIKNKNRWRLT